MNKQRSRWLATALVGIGVLTVPLVGNAASRSAGGGGEIIDGGTFVGGPPEHIDPALNTTLDAYQVINACTTGSPTSTSATRNPADRPCSPSRSSPTRTPRCGRSRSRRGCLLRRRGDPAEHVQRSWERAADLAGDYSYLLNFIDGGAERLAGEADTSRVSSPTTRR